MAGQFPEGGRVLFVRPGDDPRWWRKVEETLGVVDRDLGFSEISIRAPDQSKAFLYVADKRIVGLLLAEQIPQLAHEDLASRKRAKVKELFPANQLQDLAGSNLPN